jgi:hypothetical protein
VLSRQASLSVLIVDGFCFIFELFVIGVEAAAAASAQLPTGCRFNVNLSQFVSMLCALPQLLAESLLVNGTVVGSLRTLSGLCLAVS